MNDMSANLTNHHIGNAIEGAPDSGSDSAKELEAAVIEPAAIVQAADTAIRSVPPLWPLDGAVAVNPFLGQSHLSLAETGTHLARVYGQRPYQSRSVAREGLTKGIITPEDLAEAAARNDLAFHELLDAMTTESAPPKAVPTVADLAKAHCGRDIPALIAEQVGRLAADHFDAGQANWTVDGMSLWHTWWAVAPIDRTLDLTGMSNLRVSFETLPEHAETALFEATHTLGPTSAALDAYFQRLLATTGGWAQMAHGALWRAEQAGSGDTTGRDLLAILLSWEAQLLAHLPELAKPWSESVTAYAHPVAPSRDDQIDTALQEAFEIAARTQLHVHLGKSKGTPKTGPKVQAAFCIDVRSEVFRRALEAASGGQAKTIGFAGFFGVATKHQPMARKTGPLCPVLLTPDVASREAADPMTEAAARTAGVRSGVLAGFRTAAVSCFAHVETLGLAKLPELLRDSLGRTKSAPTATRPTFDPPMPLEQKIQRAEGVLRAMSLTVDFAPLVLLAGHGADVTNNAHAAALECGACGGHAGDVNARLLADLLNETEVRTGLSATGIKIPSDTLFVAGLHNTTTDVMTLFDTEGAVQIEALDELREWLAVAGAAARAERAPELPGSNTIPARARDWAEVRPEWGLAGCKAFIAAPRSMTDSVNLDGRAFLHSYEWRADERGGFPVLELIMTAPVVVASWISLQYYGSTVMPDTFGAGNKLLHNVTGGIGVLEGASHVLRPGLPIQSVHDGQKNRHQPLRMDVILAAPQTAVSEVLAKHDGVRALFDNGWLALHLLNDKGQVTTRYIGDLDWQTMEKTAQKQAA